MASELAPRPGVLTLMAGTMDSYAMRTKKSTKTVELFTTEEKF